VTAAVPARSQAVASGNIVGEPLLTG